MQPFNLDIWLEDKSRKVVTRDGRPVRIVCWNVKGLFPVLALLEGDGKMDTKKGDEYPCSYRIDGTCIATESYDLFFADEEEELTEFEKKVLEISGKNYNYVPSIKVYAQILLDLARKELFKEQEHCVIIPEDDYYEQLASQYQKGQEDALKDLPKWKKATEHIDIGRHVAIIEDDRVILSDYVEEGEYYIALDDLKALPKEE